MHTLQKVIIGGVVLFIVARVGSSLVNTAPHANLESLPTATTSQAVAVTNPPPAKPSITAKERKKILADATRNLKSNRDKIEKITFYTPAGGDAPKTQVTAYNGLHDTDGPYIRVRAVYFSSNWVFLKRSRFWPMM